MGNDSDVLGCQPHLRHTGPVVCFLQMPVFFLMAKARTTPAIKVATKGLGA